jgi:hypothetical protein
MFRFSTFATRRLVAVPPTGAAAMSAAAATVNAAVPRIAAARRAQTDDASGSGAAATKRPSDLSVEAVWALWNEGNLFSLSAADLSQFLTAHSVAVDAAWKKAALVRQVEDVLRAREAKRKLASAGGGATPGAAAPAGSSPGGAPPGGLAPRSDGDVYGRWEGQAGGAQPRTEMLLDLSASGFYSQSAADATAAAVPKAFQLFSGASSPDLVLSRVNTTSFPGFAANAECFTFTGADAQQATRSRYSKATQWSILNARHLNLTAEIVADLGKLILRNDVVSKNRYVVSAYALQQRVQRTPSLWVSATSTRAMSALEAILTKEHGFASPTSKAMSFEARIRRKNDAIVAELDAKAATTGVFSAPTHIQTAYWLAPTVGQDVRFLVRTRRAVEDSSEYTKAPILDVSGDEAKSLLKPNLGEITYASENEKRVFVKRFDAYSVEVTETLRQPLIISRNEDEGARTEVTISVSVPQQATADKFDPAGVTASVFDLAVQLATAANASFVSEFNLTAEPVVTTAVSAAP